MRDKTEQILEAARLVFLRKGFSGATTQEIAKEAEVAELTLFRKFANKQNLFFMVFKPLIKKQFSSKLAQLAEQTDTHLFFRQILEDRLETVSGNRQVFTMLISESLMNHFIDEINLPELMFNSLQEAIEAHFASKHQTVDAVGCTKLLAGILMGHLIWENNRPFHELTMEAKDELLKRYALALETYVHGHSK